MTQCIVMKERTGSANLEVHSAPRTPSFPVSSLRARRDN
jgi:hypothetical protein